MKVADADRLLHLESRTTELHYRVVPGRYATCYPLEP